MAPTFHSTPESSRISLWLVRLLYTVRSEDGSRYGLYSMDVERGIPHRLNLGVEQYISVSASADGSRLVATVSNPSGNLWIVPVSEGVAGESAVKSLTLPTARAVVPRSGPDYLLYFHPEAAMTAFGNSRTARRPSYGKRAMGCSPLGSLR